MNEIIGSVMAGGVQSTPHSLWVLDAESQREIMMSTTTNLSLDAMQFLRQTVTDAQDDVSFAYPCKHLDHDRGHAALMRISARLELLDIFLRSLDQEVKANAATQ